MSFYFIASKNSFQVTIDSVDEYFLKNENENIYIRGYPVFKNSSNISPIIEAIQQGKSLEVLAKELDGSFINDRFAYYPCYYYASREEIIISSFFSFFFKTVKPLCINKTAVLEFLHFQRLLGEHTYLEGVEF